MGPIWHAISIGSPGTRRLFFYQCAYAISNYVGPKDAWKISS